MCRQKGGKSCFEAPGNAQQRALHQEGDRLIHGPQEAFLPWSLSHPPSFNPSVLPSSPQLHPVCVPVSGPPVPAFSSAGHDWPLVTNTLKTQTSRLARRVPAQSICLGVAVRKTPSPMSSGEVWGGTHSRENPTLLHTPPHVTKEGALGWQCGVA